MYDVDDLYQDVVLDHSRRPRNFKPIEDADRSQEGFNPLCGDRITVYMTLDGEVISDVSFEGSGCAISKASASMMTESIKGKSRADAEEIFGSFRAMITRESDAVDREKLGDLEILEGVSAYPTRIKCATLSWHAMHAALADKEGTVSTES
jgi:nitrogen fixation NifU-like protein